MTSSPAVSVVVGVRDGGDALLPSLQTILSQDVDLELIVVDDGSRDATPERLRSLAGSDGRVRVHSQEHRGLTTALAQGCAMARGEFIARHDADDESLPGRLAAQLALLRETRAVVFASSWARSVGPEGELLVEFRRPADPEVATRQLRSGAEGPPGHGSVTFRREAYESVGGYRPAFRYAQDWDLWLRLSEVGQLCYVQRCLYAFRVASGSTSMARRHQQERLRAVALAAAALRSSQRDEEPALDEAARVSTWPPGRTRWCQTDGDYFIGRCLMRRGDPRAIGYLSRSARSHPLCPRAWAAWVVARLTLRHPRTSGSQAA